MDYFVLMKHTLSWLVMVVKKCSPQIFRIRMVAQSDAATVAASLSSLSTKMCIAGKMRCTLRTEMRLGGEMENGKLQKQQHKSSTLMSSSLWCLLACKIVCVWFMS